MHWRLEGDKGDYYLFSNEVNSWVIREFKGNLDSNTFYFYTNPNGRYLFKAKEWCFIKAKIQRYKNGLIKEKNMKKYYYICLDRGDNTAKGPYNTFQEAENRVKEACKKFPSLKFVIMSTLADYQVETVHRNWHNV